MRLPLFLGEGKARDRISTCILLVSVALPLLAGGGGIMSISRTNLAFPLLGGGQNVHVL